MNLIDMPNGELSVVVGEVVLIVRVLEFGLKGEAAVNKDGI